MTASVHTTEHIEALLRRSRRGAADLELRAETVLFWKGYTKGLEDLLSGTGQWLLELDIRPGQMPETSDQSASTREVASTTRLLRLSLHGLQIDVECREGLVVDLVVCAQKQEPTVLGRLRQHLSNALRRAANRCDSGDHDDSVGVTEVQVLTKPVQHSLPDFSYPYVFKRLPVRSADGKTHYQSFAVHEGVVDGIDDILAELRVMNGGRISADDLHSIPSELFGSREVIVSHEREVRQ